MLSLVPHLRPSSFKTTMKSSLLRVDLFSQPVSSIGHAFRRSLQIRKQRKVSRQTHRGSNSQTTTSRRYSIVQLNERPGEVGSKFEPFIPPISLSSRQFVDDGRYVGLIAFKLSKCEGNVGVVAGGVRNLHHVSVNGLCEFKTAPGRLKGALHRFISFEQIFIKAHGRLCAHVFQLAPNRKAGIPRRAEGQGGGDKGLPIPDNRDPSARRDAVNKRSRNTEPRREHGDEDEQNDNQGICLHPYIVTARRSRLSRGHVE